MVSPKQDVLALPYSISISTPCSMNFILPGRGTSPTQQLHGRMTQQCLQHPGSNYNTDWTNVAIGVVNSEIGMTWNTKRGKSVIVTSDKSIKMTLQNTTLSPAPTTKHLGACLQNGRVTSDSTTDRIKVARQRLREMANTVNHADGYWMRLG